MYRRDMDEAIRKDLEQLDRDQLLELIDRLSYRDRSIDQEIAAFARRRKSSEHVRELRRWIQRWAPRQAFAASGNSAPSTGAS